MEEQETVNMLLDIENYSGATSKRIAPAIIFIIVSGLPMVIYVYYLLGIIPLIPMLIFEVLWTARWGLIILGEESKRKNAFKKQILDIYSSSHELLNIKYIHPDGCIEYLNGNVCYMVIAQNGNISNPLLTAQINSKFFSTLSDTFKTDIYVQDISTSDVLRQRYNGVQLFNDPSVMKDFLDIIDYNIKSTNEQSLLTRTIYAVEGRKSEYQNIKDAIISAIQSDDAVIYKSLKLATKEDVEMIISEDLDTYIDYEELIRNKYRTEDYHGSRVLSYDQEEPEEKLVIEEDDLEERSFMLNE